MHGYKLSNGCLLNAGCWVLILSLLSWGLVVGGTPIERTFQESWVICCILLLQEWVVFTCDFLLGRWSIPKDLLLAPTGQSICLHDLIWLQQHHLWRGSWRCACPIVFPIIFIFIYFCIFWSLTGLKKSCYLMSKWCHKNNNDLHNLKTIIFSMWKLFIMSIFFSFTIPTITTLFFCDVIAMNEALRKKRVYWW